MIKYIMGFLVSVVLVSAPAAFGAEGTGGYLEGGPSETFETPSLDLQRSYYGIFEKERELKPVRGRTREAKPLTESVIKEVPTFAEVEAAKVKATAETAMEVAVEARKAAIEAKAISKQAITSANQSIQTANQAIDKTNQMIDQVNAINEKVIQENAKLRFEMEQKAQALEQTDQGLSDEMENLKKEIEKLTVKEAKKSFSFYTVKKGDFLIKIAGKKDVYGQGDAWKKIYQANRDKVKNPNLIYPGQKLQIPGSDGAAPAGVKVKSVQKVKKPVVPVPTKAPTAAIKPLVPGQRK